MQNNDAIEVVAPLGGGISEVALFPDAAAVLTSTAGAVRMMLQPVSRLADGNYVDLSNSIATF